MHRAPAHGPEHRLEADLRAAVHTDAHRVGCRGGRRGRQQVQHIQAQPERVCRRRVAAGLHHDRARVGGVIDPELHQLPLAVRGPHQGRLRPRLHRGAERVHEGHVPVARARRHARHPNRHRPAGRKERRRHLQEHVAEGVAHVVRPDVAERQRHAAGAAHGPVLGHAAGAGDEPERRPPVEVQVEGAVATRRAGGVGADPDEGARCGGERVGRGGGGPLDGHAAVGDAGQQRLAGVRMERVVAEALTGDRGVEASQTAVAGGQDRGDRGARGDR